MRIHVLLSAALALAWSLGAAAQGVGNAGGVGRPIGGGGSGSVVVDSTSGLSGAGTAGSPLKFGQGYRIATLSSDTVTSTDLSKVIHYSNASANAISIPGASTIASGKSFGVMLENGAAAGTVTPQSGTVYGASSLTLPAKSSCWLTSDGTSNWLLDSCTAVSGGGGGGGISAVTSTGNTILVTGSSSINVEVNPSVPLYVSSTTTPTMAAGTLILSGSGTIPVPGAPGEALIESNTSTGLTLIGKGSSLDFDLVSSAGSTICSVAASTVILQCPSLKPGTITFVRLAFSNTAPTLGGSAGFCTGPAISGANGTAAFIVTIGTSCAAATGTVTFSASTNGWACDAYDLTNPDTYVIRETSTANTGASFKAYSASAPGTASNWTAGDAIQFHCVGY